MKALRATRGKTSSGDTFWLMPAMRRNERRGPGISIWSSPGGSCDGAKEEPGSELLIVCALSRQGESKEHSIERRSAKRRKETQRGNFTAQACPNLRDETDRLSEHHGKEAFGGAVRRLQSAPGFGNCDLLGPGKLVRRLRCRPVSWSCLSGRQDKSFLAVIQESF